MGSTSGKGKREGKAPEIGGELVAEGDVRQPTPENAGEDKWREQVEEVCARGNFREAVLLASKTSERASGGMFEDFDEAWRDAQQIIRHPLADLDADSTLKAKVRGSLLASWILEELEQEAGDRLYRCLGGAPPCPSLIAWMRGPDEAYVVEDDEEELEPEEVALEYASRRLQELRCAEGLRECMKFRLGRGIGWMKHAHSESQSPNPEGPRPCVDGPKFTPWDRLLELPKLPCGWGCRCEYMHSH
jgi:hypothetical protein